MRFEVTTLGTGAALPARGRYPTAQLLNAHERLYLIDCGEGTQERLRQAGANMNRIDTVLISHMHGDHYLGLMGLISTMHLQGRTTELRVFGPAILKEVLDVQLRASETYLRFPLRFQALRHSSGDRITEDERMEVLALELKHRIPTTGFLFREKPHPRRLRDDKLGLIPVFARDRVKQGEDLVLADGTRISNSELTSEPLPQRSYAYCSDTAPLPALVEHLRGVDLLYHEATFTSDLSARAKETMHSTAAQAAMVAHTAEVGQLLLGHFSSRYKSNDILLQEALPIFPRTLLAEEGRTFRIGC